MHPKPVRITLHRGSRTLDVAFDDGVRFALGCEYLRVHSPSAEVAGHGSGQGTLPVGKHGVNIEEIQPVGNYAVTLVFDDGHRSGIFSWETLYRLGRDHDANWQHYLERLQAAGHSHPAFSGV